MAMNETNNYILKRKTDKYGRKSAFAEVKNYHPVFISWTGMVDSFARDWQ